MVDLTYSVKYMQVYWPLFYAPSYSFSSMNMLELRICNSLTLIKRVNALQRYCKVKNCFKGSKFYPERYRMKSHWDLLAVFPQYMNGVS